MLCRVPLTSLEECLLERADKQLLMYVKKMQSRPFIDYTICIVTK